MGKTRSAIHGPRAVIATIGGLGALLLVVVMATETLPSKVEAGWPWTRANKHAACGHKGCTPDHCQYGAGWAGERYWMRSPDQEQRVVMSLYNRYCIRCHGIDGRGVWDIPDVPDFADTPSQTSRSDKQIVSILM